MIHQKSHRPGRERFGSSLLASLIRKTNGQRESAAQAKFFLWCDRLREASSRDGNGPILDCVLDAALSMSSADRANIQLVEDGELVIKGQRGFSKAFLDYFRILGDSNTACRMAWKNQRLVIVPDITSSAIYSRGALEALLDDGIRAVDSVPLLTDSGRMLGVLSVHYCRPHVHRGADLARFKKLARFVANLMH